MVDNKALRYKYFRLSPEKYVQYYKKLVSENPKVNLVFGRLKIANQEFLEEATINFWKKWTKSHQRYKIKIKRMKK